MSFLQKVTIASRRSAYRLVVAALSVLLVTSIFWITQQHAAAVRFINRSLYINSSIAGDTTFYTITFTYPTNNNVGSVRMLFCTEAIPYLPCDAPQGLDVSNVVLSTQSGSTGFTLTQQSANSLVISRPPVPPGITESKYTFTNVINPTSIGTFYVRLNSYSSTDATGSYIDYGSIASSTANQLGIETQVPPILIFCVGKEINGSCDDVVPTGVDEYENPSTEDTMAGSNDMFAYTNARGGYVISVVGRSLTSGIYEIPAIAAGPEESLSGKGQFGINMANNSNPDVGAVPIGPATNVTLNADYTQSDKFLFKDGDILATSDWVTKDKKFTVSYIVNIPPDQHPGVYNTTVTFICTGNF
jgi:hypothetical protein